MCQSVGMSETFFETFAQAIDGVIRDADANDVLLARPSEVWSMVQEPLNYGESRRGDFAIELLKGRPTKKFFHVSIYRMDSGRYELIDYVL
jgi:hypothetical protein